MINRCHPHEARMRYLLALISFFLPPRSHSLHRYTGSYRVSTRVFLTGLNSPRIPTCLALIDINQDRRRHLGKYFETILVFSILAITVTLYLHERTRSGTIDAYGYWIVTSNEPQCRTGCTANVSRYHRIEAQMINHQTLWDNSLDMCSTTPADYEGHHFDRPDRCDQSLLGCSVTGVWFFKHERC
ncbi:hypothetical protein F5146DRAFT_1074597 [Armillaria mellea]|nr:hypothetical protein F5146DRAFT_1074597 [Armillaria mellea]